MNENMNKSDPQQEYKHIQILQGLQRIDEAIDSLDKLACRMEGCSNIDPTGELTTKPEETLGSILATTGKQLNSKAQTIHKIINHMEELLF